MKLVYLSSLPTDGDEIWQGLRKPFSGLILHVPHQGWDPWQIARRLNTSQVIYILRLRDREEIEAFARLRDAFTDVSLVLVLPDQDEKTLALGHSLHPRFIAYADGGLGTLVDVLVKMIRTAEERSGEGRARA